MKGLWAAGLLVLLLAGGLVGLAYWRTTELSRVKFPIRQSLDNLEVAVDAVEPVRSQGQAGETKTFKLKGHVRYPETLAGIPQLVWSAKLVADKSAIDTSFWETRSSGPAELGFDYSFTASPKPLWVGFRGLILTREPAMDFEHPLRFPEEELQGQLSDFLPGGGAREQIQVTWNSNQQGETVQATITLVLNSAMYKRYTGGFCVAELTNHKGQRFHQGSSVGGSSLSFHWERRWQQGDTEAVLITQPAKLRVYTPTALQEVSKSFVFERIPVPE